MLIRNRLQLVLKKVEPCRCLVDIGTDHAYIPVKLIEDGVVENAIAGDIKKGPLKVADKNIKLYGMDDKVKTRQGNGLEVVYPGECDCIVIAGMGGELISKILELGIEVAKSAKQIVIQPMNAMEILRGWLYINGFNIYDEELTREGDKIYNVMCCKYDGEKREVPMEHLEIGEMWIKNEDPLLNDWIEKRVVKYAKVIDGINRTKVKDMEKLENAVYLKDKLIELQSKLGGIK